MKAMLESILITEWRPGGFELLAVAIFAGRIGFHCLFKP